MQGCELLLRETLIKIENQNYIVSDKYKNLLIVDISIIP